MAKKRENNFDRIILISGIVLVVIALIGIIFIQFSLRVQMSPAEEINILSSVPLLVGIFGLLGISLISFSVLKNFFEKKNQEIAEKVISDVPEED